MAKEKNNLDDFWDISMLVPAKKISSSKPIKSISATEIVVSEQENRDKEDNKLHLQNRPQKPQTANEASVTYENLSSLIKKTVVCNWQTSYNYYELFTKQALYYQTVEAVECERENFFSYMPQFSQMNKKQLDWYLWWKKNVNRGVYLDTYFTYILLYAFELINLSNEKNAKASLDTLINLWSNYSNEYPQINKTLGEWVCDFSLVYQLPISFPDARITQEMINGTSLPEVFYSFDFKDSRLLAKFLLTYCNSYNYRKSKFYDENTKELYETHIIAAVEKLIESGNLSEKLFCETEKKASRIAYMGALCTYQAKKRIEVTYSSPSLETELRAYVSNVIKYIENVIRSAAGIRSKLGIKNIDGETKRILDMYFDGVFGRNSEIAIKPEYERLYDVKDEEFSFEAAKAIEISSWDVTKKLVEAFEEEPLVDIETTEEIALEQQPVADGSPLARFYSEIKGYSQLFELIKDKKFADQLKYVKENKLIFEAVVDEINEIAAEIFDDILIEEADVGYKIIDDYKELLEE